MMPEPLTLSHEEWLAKGKELFGEDFEQWRFVCPVCKNVARTGEFKPFKDKGANPDSATCECIGRYVPGSAEAFGEKKPKRPCNYAGYGLFRLSPVRVTFPDGKDRHCFAFDEGEASAS
jgi:hypothetical protein